MAGPRVRMITHPTLLTRLPRDPTEDGWAIVSVGAVSFALIAVPVWRVGGNAMGRAFFPRILVQLIRLEGGTSNHLYWDRRIEMGLDTSPHPWSPRRSFGRLDSMLKRPTPAHAV